MVGKGKSPYILISMSLSLVRGRWGEKKKERTLERRRGEEGENQRPHHNANRHLDQNILTPCRGRGGEKGKGGQKTGATQHASGPASFPNVFVCEMKCAKTRGGRKKKGGRT